MRIVVDTNTAISGLLWPGHPRRLIDLIRGRTHTLCLSLALLAELAEVIARPKFAQRLADAGLSASALVQDYSRLAEIVEPASLPQPVSRDPDDDVVRATALAANALLIVSGDRDLLDLGSFSGIRILNAAEALRALGA
jgi:putative PIN family toxin of toxin-antitoxin system